MQARPMYTVWRYTEGAIVLSQLKGSTTVEFIGKADTMHTDAVSPGKSCSNSSNL